MKKNDTKQPILLSSKLKAVIRKEFGISKPPVDNALAWRTNSYLAQKIRERAKELLLIEANKVIPHKINSDTESTQTNAAG